MIFADGRNNGAAGAWRRAKDLLSFTLLLEGRKCAVAWWWLFKERGKKESEANEQGCSMPAFLISRLFQNSRNLPCHFAFYCRCLMLDHVNAIDHPHTNEFSQTYVWKLVFSFSIISFSHILKARLMKSLLESIHLRKEKEIYHF